VVELSNLLREREREKILLRREAENKKLYA
jgi:hypothetical protein